MAAVMQSEASCPVLLGRLSNPSSGIKGAYKKVAKTGKSAATAARAAASKLPVLLGRTRVARELPSKLPEMDVECVLQVGALSVEVVEVQVANPEDEARRMAVEAHKAAMERKARRASRAVLLEATH